MLNPSKRIENSHGECLWTLAWCRENIITGSLDGTMKVWKAEGNECIFATEKSKIGISSVLALQDGLTAVACYQDSTIKFFDLLHSGEKYTLDLKFGEAYSLSISPGEDILVSGSSSGNINVWSMLDNHEKVTSIAAGNKPIISTNFSVEGRLASGANDGSTYVHDVSTQQQTHKFDSHSLPVRCVSFFGDGKMLLSASDDRQVQLYDVRVGQPIFTFSHKAPAYSVDASPNLRHFVVGCQDGSVSMWDIGGLREVRKYDSHRDSVWCVQYDKRCDGNRFASTGDDGAVQLYG